MTSQGCGCRFIHRLGLYEVACRELLKLAQMNRLGKNQEWEFNEWMHGRTGKPMGKCYQAWSASSYIVGFTAARTDMPPLCAVASHPAAKAWHQPYFARCWDLTGTTEAGFSTPSQAGGFTLTINPTLNPEARADPNGWF